MPSLSSVRRRAVNNERLSWREMKKLANRVRLASAGTGTAVALPAALLVSHLSTRAVQEGVLRAGLPLATLGRSHIEPAHALAMALDPETARQTINLTDEQAASYLSGEAFPVDAPTGWTLAAWRGLPLGWCKITGGTLKNHLPKGLRRRG